METTVENARSEARAPVQAEAHSADTRLVLMLLAPSWIALAWLVSKVQWIWTNRPEMQFGWIVVLLCGYLTWENWPRRPALRLRATVGNVLGAAIALGLLFVVQVYQASFGTNAASLVGHALGTMLLVGANLHFVFGGRGLLVFGFPIGFLLIAMPMPSAIHNLLTQNLQSFIATLNVELLNLVGVPAQRIGSLIQLPSGTVGVNEACSGIRSLQSAAMATLFIGFLTLRSNTLRVLLFAGGAGFAVLGNIIRSFYLSYMASSRGVASVNQVHDAAGWSILLFTAGGVMALAWFLGRIEKAAQSGRVPPASPVVPATPPASASTP